MTSEHGEDCAALVELWQTEWCPHSAKVRQRLTEEIVGVLDERYPDGPDSARHHRKAADHGGAPPS